jgi:hypothetical protein
VSHTFKIKEKYGLKFEAPLGGEIRRGKVFSLTDAGQDAAAHLLLRAAGDEGTNTWPRPRLLQDLMTTGNLQQGVIPLTGGITARTSVPSFVRSKQSRFTGCTLSISVDAKSTRRHDSPGLL